MLFRCQSSLSEIEYTSRIVTNGEYSFIPYLFFSVYITLFMNKCRVSYK